MQAFEYTYEEVASAIIKQSKTSYTEDKIFTPVADEKFINDFFNNLSHIFKDLTDEQSKYFLFEEQEPVFTNYLYAFTINQAVEYLRKLDFHKKLDNELKEKSQGNKTKI